MKKLLSAIAILLQVLPIFINATAVSKPRIDPKDIVVIEGRRYYFSTIVLNAPEAITLCQEVNMTLAGFETEQEYDAVSNYIKYDLGSAEFFFTSGSRQYKTYIWTNTGEPVSFFKWDVGQPDVTDTTTQHNICIKNGPMHDCSPHLNYRFVCEQKTYCSSCVSI